MSDPGGAVLAAVEAALRASAALATAMGAPPAIYTALPTNKPMPYVVLGEDLITGDDDECADASEVIVEVHLWARPATPAGNAAALQARAMGGAIRAALTADLTISGQDLDDYQFEAARYGTDPDGSCHGVLSFRYLVTATS